ncbi:MAG: M20/M25/M40 family metallo-hydrolase [Planctomycetota bacterium]
MSPVLLGILAAASLIGGFVILSPETQQRRPAAAMPVLPSQSAMVDDVRALAAPAMRGRSEETGGAALAAEFVERRFKSLGLRTEQQSFEIPRRRLLAETRLQTGRETFVPGTDFAPLTWSGNAFASGPLVAGLASRICGDSLAGGIAVERLPAAPGMFRTLVPSLADRALAYQDLGAVGVLFVADSRDPSAGGEAAWASRLDERTEARLKGEPDGVRGWARDRAAVGAQSRAPRPSRPLRIPAALVSYDAGRRIDESLNATAGIRVAIEDEPLAGANVISMLPGEFPGRAAVILCAHYDSHGLQPPSPGHPAGRLYPGACDNASGIAVLLAVAEALAHDSRSLPHPVIFAAFGGEELGLHGSRAFAAALPRLRGGALCAINVDMAARNAENEISLVGSAFAPDVASIARKSMEEAGFAVLTTMKGGFDIDFTFRNGSDHWPLHQAGVPSVLFTCSRFPECDTPGDTPNLCSPAKLRKVAEAVLAAVLAASRRQETFARPVDAVVKFPGEK